MIIFGTRRSSRFLAAQAFVCAHCGREAVQRLLLLTSWFTLFFIPVVPYRRRRVFTCAYCGAGTRLDPAEAERFVADAARA